MPLRKAWLRPKTCPAGPFEARLVQKAIARYTIPSHLAARRFAACHEELECLIRKGVIQNDAQVLAVPTIICIRCLSANARIAVKRSCRIGHARAAVITKVAK